MNYTIATMQEMASHDTINLVADLQLICCICGAAVCRPLIYIDSLASSIGHIE